MGPYHHVGHGAAEPKPGGLGGSNGSLPSGDLGRGGAGGLGGLGWCCSEGGLVRMVLVDSSGNGLMVSTNG